MSSHTFSFKALPDVRFEMTPPSMVRSYVVTANGAPVKRRLGGFEVEHGGEKVKVKTRGSLSPLSPIFEYAGERVQPGPPPPPTWLLLFALLPIGLVFVGGAIGGALGAAGWFVNLSLLHRAPSPAIGALTCLAVTGAAAGLWYGIASALFGG